MDEVFRYGSDCKWLMVRDEKVLEGIVQLADSRPVTGPAKARPEQA